MSYRNRNEQARILTKRIASLYVQRDRVGKEQGHHPKDVARIRRAIERDIAYAQHELQGVQS